jgi:hypothetical protein
MLLDEECIWPDEEWWCPRRGGKSSEGGMLVGVVGSEKNSRSKPPALIFMSVSFSGVIWFAVDVVDVSAMIAMSEMYSEKQGDKSTECKAQTVARTYIAIGKLESGRTRCTRDRTPPAQCAILY